MTTPMKGRDRMLAACHRLPVDATPIWFMRQAGRALPEYRKLREKYEILTIAKTPDLATEVSLMPVRRLGVDAAVLYADIMLVLEGMGLPYHIEPEIGPIVPNPLRTAADIERLNVIPAEEATPYVFEAIRQVRRALGNETAVVGFAGGPFTLACYMIEGHPSRDFAAAKGLMFSQPLLWHALMEKTTEVLVRYLHAQVDAGVYIIQLFDSWVGGLGPAHYERYVLPYSRRIFQEIRSRGTPTIHFGTGTAGLLKLMATAGSDVMSVDWRLPLDEAWERIGSDKGIQGNLDPSLLSASPE
ncbi:MAG: uroporphyrinogen decarboxylase, partial [Chloroflexi bacterium]|nr:uroporphyrinogen decarboxylase [Chloroflexota bacterium]